VHVVTIQPVEKLFTNSNKNSSNISLGINHCKKQEKRWL